MQKQLKAKDLFFFLQRRCNPAYYFLFSYRKSKISEITAELVDFQMTRPLIWILQQMVVKSGSEKVSGDSRRLSFPSFLFDARLLLVEVVLSQWVVWRLSCQYFLFFFFSWPLVVSFLTFPLFFLLGFNYNVTYTHTKKKKLGFSSVLLLLLCFTYTVVSANVCFFFLFSLFVFFF